MNNCSRTEPYVHIPDSKEPHGHVNSSRSQEVLAARYVQMFTLPSKRSVCQSGRWLGRARPNKAKERP